MANSRIIPKADRKPAPAPQKGKRSNPPFGPGAFFLWLLVAFLAALGIGGLAKVLPPAIPIFYLGASLICGVVYARDKGKAERQEWRTPESILHLLDLLGGWPGGLLGQRIYRHKTRKVGFQILFWLSVVAHLVAWGWILVRVPAETDPLRFGGRVLEAFRRDVLSAIGS